VVLTLRSIEAPRLAPSGREILTLKAKVPPPADAATKPPAKAAAKPGKAATTTTQPPIPAASAPEAIAAATRAQERRGALQALRVLLAEKWPMVFGPTATVRPLKVGIHHDLQALLPDVDQKLLRCALARHCERPRYQHAILDGGPRYDLDGQPRGEVTPEQIADLRARRAGSTGNGYHKPLQ
jgi:ProP effector